MARGRKKKTGEAATREPSTPVIEEQENAKQPTGPVREPVTGHEEAVKATTREPRYFIVKGAFTAGNTVITKNDKHRPGDEPGQMRPEYTPGGADELDKWVKAGFMVKK